jgi:hypothetical protein
MENSPKVSMMFISFLKPRTFQPNGFLSVIPRMAAVLGPGRFSG